MNEEDLQRLESHLDDALTESQEARLKEEMFGDPQLVGALEALREQRKLRDTWFNALEGTPEEGKSLSLNVRSAIADRERRRIRASLIQRFAIAVACVAVGFSAGLFARSGAHLPQAQSQAPAPDKVAAAIPSQHHVGSSTRPGQSIFVEIRDNDGNVLAHQAFDSYEKARAFQTDLERLQKTQTQTSYDASADGFAQQL